MDIFLDSCAIIYWVELKEPYYSRFIRKLELINQKYPKGRVVVSRLSVLECCVGPIKHQQEEYLHAYEKFFSDPALKIIDLDNVVINLATQIRAETSLKTPDAIQVACAKSCANLGAFVTNDKVFKKISDFPVELI